MNDIVEMWHLPWHALQRDLALGLGADAIGDSIPGDKPATPSAAITAISWLSRARLRAAPPMQARQ